MKLKVPPVVVFLFFAFLMYLLAEFLPFGQFEFFGRKYLMGALLVGGVLVAAIALVQLATNKTTVNPAHPEKSVKLVDTGIYAYSRNPMYLALLMVLLAWGLGLGNAFNTLLAAAFVGYMNRFQIKAEEEALHSLFGKEYRQYCIKTRRWF